MNKAMLTSLSNEKVKTVTLLLKQSKARKQKGVFVAEGIRMVSEVPAQLLCELYLSESFVKKEENLPIIEKLTAALQTGSGAEPVLVSDAVFEKMSDTMHPQGILAVVRQPSYSMEELLSAGTGGRYLILENVQDPGNVGTMIRTAEAAGVSGVFLSAGCADLFNPKTVRSTMGALFRVPFAHFADTTAFLGQLKESGITVYAATLEGSVEFTKASYADRCAVMIGNEGAGLSEAAVAAADARVRIPMEGKVESLNASISAALFLYEVKRQHENR